MKAVVDGIRKDIRAVWFEGGEVRMIDQRLLPARIGIVGFRDYRDVAEAIRNMTTRGAPSIGASAAYGMCLAALNGDDLAQAAGDIKAARPTAYNLFHAVDWMSARLAEGEDPVKAADTYAETTVEKCRSIGRYGGELIEDGMKLMTHCNAGALATVDVGTALAPMRYAHDAGRDFFVYVSETRPRLQGMQLTAWELWQEGIEHRIIPDGASAYYMSQGVDMIITGADRITANGAFANKIGTFDKGHQDRPRGLPGAEPRVRRHPRGARDRVHHREGDPQTGRGPRHEGLTWTRRRLAGRWSRPAGCCTTGTSPCRPAGT